MMTPDNTNETVLDPSFDISSVTFPPGTKLREIERIVILETLKQRTSTELTQRCSWNRYRTLQRKLKRYGASDWGLKTKSLRQLVRVNELVSAQLLLKLKHEQLRKSQLLD